jgi:hypothetical protein
MAPFFCRAVTQIIRRQGSCTDALYPLGDFILNKFVLLIALFAATDIAWAATGSGAVNSTGAAASPHGGAGDGAGMPSGHPGEVPADVNLINSGKVLDVLDSEMYTYLQVTHENGPLWLAAYKTDIAKGATVKYSGGIAMPNFHSKSLNRSFDLIVFVDSLEQVKK